MDISRKATVLCTLSLFLGACGSTNRHPEWRIPSTECFVLHSSSAQRDYEIMVALPPGYGESNTKYPVLYVLDANGMFPIAVETTRFLSFDRPKREPIIVGIGYPVGLFTNTLASRIRDFTPTNDATFVSELGKRFNFSPQGSGGAAAFLHFLAQQMMPVVERRYRIDENMRALHGYSMGGLFAVYVLFHEPDLFQSYLIGAPALEWDRGAAWKFEQEFTDAKKHLPARVFLAVGLLDEQHVLIVRRQDQLFRLRMYENLVWRTQFFEDETHNSAIPLTLTRGIRWLYDDMRPGS